MKEYKILATHKDMILPIVTYILARTEGDARKGFLYMNPGAVVHKVALVQDNPVK